MERKCCRFCKESLHHTFIDLGMSPLANSYLKPSELGQMESFYPLHAYVCEHCLLVQLEEFQSPVHIFGHYAYFSSYSETWLQHAKSYTEMVVPRLGINRDNQVVEIGSNDGYLLQYFVEKGIPVLGIEPAANVAEAAEKKGVPTLVKFFGSETARELVRKRVKADLLIGNNILAHVPDLNDFVMGMKMLLSPRGVVTMEFPHLLRLMEGNQFDTIYHEHFSYFSFITVQKVFMANGLSILDVDEISTHGGSLRIYSSHLEDTSKSHAEKVDQLLAKERYSGLTDLENYRAFTEGVKETKRKILEFLIAAKRKGRVIVAYGAAAKGNTLLNYCGIRSDCVEYAVDRSPHKQGHFLPGTHLPIHHPDTIKETRPDYLLILPWNLKDEIMEQMAYIRDWGGQFVTFIPDVRIYS